MVRILPLTLRKARRFSFSGGERVITTLVIPVKLIFDLIEGFASRDL